MASRALVEVASQGRAKIIITGTANFSGLTFGHLLCRLCWQVYEYLQHQLRNVIKTLFKISYKIRTKNYKIKTGSRLTR